MYLAHLNICVFGLGLDTWGYKRERKRRSENTLDLITYNCSLLSTKIGHNIIQLHIHDEKLQEEH